MKHCLIWLFNNIFLNFNCFSVFFKIIGLFYFIWCTISSFWKEKYPIISLLFSLHFFAFWYFWKPSLTNGRVEYFIIFKCISLRPLLLFTHIRLQIQDGLVHTLASCFFHQIIWNKGALLDLCICEELVQKLLQLFFPLFYEWVIELLFENRGHDVFLRWEFWERSSIRNALFDLVLEGPQSRVSFKDLEGNSTSCRYPDGVLGELIVDVFIGLDIGRKSDWCCLVWFLLRQFNH